MPDGCLVQMPMCFPTPLQLEIVHLAQQSDMPRALAEELITKT